MPIWVLLKPTDMRTKGGYMFLRFRNTGLTIRISKNAALKILLIFGSIFGVFLMTGLLYFRNDVEIIDENEKRIVYKCRPL